MKARTPTSRPLDVNDLEEGDAITAISVPDGAPWSKGDRFKFRRVLPGRSFAAIDPIAGGDSVYIPVLHFSAFGRNRNATA